MLTVPAALAAAFFAGPALAEEPKTATEPRIHQDPGDIVNVLDAFDDGDPFDISIGLGFGYFNKTATIKRETTLSGPGFTTGLYTANSLQVAKYFEQTARLTPRVEVGLYKDIALYVALPIVLTNTRELKAPDGQTDPSALEGGTLPDGSKERLFTLPFQAPERNGLENITVGLHFNFMNQFRDPSKPTWLFGVEGRFAVGTAMQPCNKNPAAGQVQCAYPGDRNRNGTADGSANFEPDAGAFGNKRDAGITRGTFGLEAHTYLSRRVKYVEPYGGFSALFEFPWDGTDIKLSDLKGSLVSLPPIVGTVVLGMMVHPWENREKRARLTIDFRFQGEYHSEGRDYSELYDALGSSDAPSLRNPNYGRFMANPQFNNGWCTDNDPSTPCYPRSVVDPTSGSVYFNGAADVAAFGSYRGSTSISWQASEYVKFSLGFGLRYDQAHQISKDAPCNPSFRKEGAEVAGYCQAGNISTQNIEATGIPNPNYRPTINAIGRRFLVDDSVTWDLSLSAYAMF